MLLQLNFSASAIINCILLLLLLITMTRVARKKRAPNRDPTSLAITASTSAFEAVDTSQIDLTLLDIDAPLQSPSIEPSPSIESPPPIESQYPPIESDNDNGFDTIDTAIPEAQEGRRFTGWTIEMEATMYSTLCIQVQLGKRADSGFKKEAWQAVNKAILEASGVIITTKQCKSKADAQKALWREFNWLKDQSGFGIDRETGLITARDQAWRDVIAISNSITTPKLYIYTNLYKIAKAKA